MNTRKIRYLKALALDGNKIIFHNFNLFMTATPDNLLPVKCILLGFFFLNFLKFLFIIELNNTIFMSLEPIKTLFSIYVE